MEEIVKIYEPISETIFATTPAKLEVMKMWVNAQTEAKRKPKTLWQELLDSRQKQIKNLEQKYPWAPILYNWTIAILIVLIAAALVWWAMDINVRSKAAAEYDAAVQSFYAEQEAKAEAERAAAAAIQNSEQAKRDKDIQLMAKFLDGIKGFVQNRGYTALDLETYGQCPINRVLNPAFACSTLEEAIMQEDQWVGFSVNNQVTAENKAIAAKLVNAFYGEEAQPCSYDYCWTEFTDQGLFLKSDFGQATFRNVWRAK